VVYYGQQLGRVVGSSTLGWQQTGTVGAGTVILGSGTLGWQQFGVVRSGVDLEDGVAAGGGVIIGVGVGLAQPAKGNIVTSSNNTHQGIIFRRAIVGAKPKPFLFSTSIASLLLS